MALALIVDDEVDLCRLMQMTLKKKQIDTLVAYDMATAIDHLCQHSFDFCLTDLNLPDGSGLDIVKLINAKYPATPVAVITAHGSMDLAIEALKLGAFDFVNKPLELPRLRLLVENALKAGQDAKQQTIDTAPDLFAGKLIGNSEPITQLKATIQKLARSQAPVFLWGGSGTGKEVVAKLIHELSPRANGNFVPVNCGAIPSELMESEFFGHKKGSFTGATTDKEGLFQQANGGTLFLDEVADLPLAMQVKLLRAIQEKKIRPIGGTQEIAVDIRLLSATHKNLAKLVEMGEFRQDLYYRINVIEVKLPSLNERKGDVPILATHFLQMIATDWGLTEDIQLSEGAKTALMHHDYSGNVRELRNILERAITLADSHIIDVAHLQLTETEITPTHPPTIPSSQNATSTPSHSQETAPNIPEVAPIFPNFKTKNVPNGHSHPVENLQDGKKSLGQAPIPPTGFNLPATLANSLTKTPATNYNGNTTARQTVNIMPSQTTASKNDGVGQILPPIPTSVMQTANTNKPDTNTCLPLPPEGLEEYLLNQEKQLIISALNQCNWNKTQAAKLLNTSFRSLRYRMKKLEIDDGDL